LSRAPGGTERCYHARCRDAGNGALRYGRRAASLADIVFRKPRGRDLSD